jgi:glycosyltransferase involved in cell wall biosynthesis
MNACGRPVIGFGKGGALETIVDGKTGVLFAEQTVDSLADAILRFERLSFDPVAIRKHAERFSKANFTASLQTIVARATTKRRPIARRVVARTRPRISAPLPAQSRRLVAVR